MDVLAVAAWAALGSRLPPGPDPCGRCGRRAQLTPARQVVSDKFTGFEDWAGPCGNGLCRDCSWGLRTKSLRADPLLVDQHEPALTALSRGQGLTAVLLEPLSPRCAVTVPLRPGRKHLLPHARWGHVTTDDATLRWSSGDAHRLQAMSRLRSAGFGARMLTAPAPAWPVLRRLPPDAQARILAEWPALDPWRSRSPWLRLGLHATTPPRTTRAAAR